MLKMIKLTCCKYYSTTQRIWEPMYINTKSIATLYWNQDLNYTEISFITNERLKHVEETPEQILQLIKEAENV